MSRIADVLKGDDPKVPAAGARPGYARRLLGLVGLAETGPAGEAGPLPAHGRRISVHVLVLALGIALVAPAIGFLAHLVGQQEVALRRQLDDRGRQIATDVTDRLEQEIESLGTMLAVFATSGWLQDDELHLLHRRAGRALAGTGRHLIVLDEELNQLLNTRVPYGEPLGRTSDPATAERVLHSGEPVVSEVFIGRVAGAPVFNVLHPVTLPGGRRRVLILTRNTESLDDLLVSVAAEGVWHFVVLDGNDRVVTGSDEKDEVTGEHPLACRAAGEADGSSAGEDDRPVFLQRVGGSDWRVCVWTAPGAAGTGVAWTGLFTAAAAWVVVAMVAAVMLSVFISRSIARTARIGVALGRGGDVRYLPSVIAEVDTVRRTLAAAAAERVRNERRLELMLGEAAHRARNQIALAASLVELSARHASSAAELKQDLTGRLLALGRSVDALTGRKPGTALLETLVTAQLAPFVDDSGERLTADGDEVLISDQAAQSLTLVLHELATNASKHGAWARPDGRVSVSWRRDGDDLVVDWFEDGAAAEPPDGTGFGSTLMKSLVESSLSGRLERSFDGTGFRCRIVLPFARLAPRPELP